MALILPRGLTPRRTERAPFHSAWALTKHKASWLIRDLPVAQKEFSFFGVVIKDHGYVLYSATVSTSSISFHFNDNDNDNDNLHILVNLLRNYTCKFSGHSTYVSLQDSKDV